jgi:ribosomal protein S18 acetylase RimI-like enzyme
MYYSEKASILKVEMSNFFKVIELPWDSNLLQRKAVRLQLFSNDYPEDLLSQLNILCKELDVTGVQHVSCRVKSDDLSLIQALTNERFLLVDGILSFSNNALKREDIKHLVIEIGADFSKQVGDIARSAFTIDRFHNDPSIEHELANNLHAEWATNSVARIAADMVLGVVENDILKGFITIKQGNQTATIVLIVVDEKFTGQGIGRSLVQAAINWAISQGLKIVEVGTQAANIPAARLYISMGFSLSSSSLSFRRVPPGGRN